MRGITPVVAIVLLLLIAVAAAGGAYLFYNSFQAEAQSSHTEAKQQFFEAAGAELHIRSVEDGMIYVQNMGTTDQDIENINIYIDGRPLAVETSDTTLDAGEWVAFKITEPHRCEKSDCTLKIAGIDRTETFVSWEDLNCTSNPKCFLWEGCECRLSYFTDDFSDFGSWENQSSGGSEVSVSDSVLTCASGPCCKTKQNLPPRNVTSLWIRLRASSPDAGTCSVSTDSSDKNLWQFSPSADFEIYNLTPSGRTTSDNSEPVSMLNLSASGTCKIDFIELIKP